MEDAFKKNGIGVEKLISYLIYKNNYI